MNEELKARIMAVYDAIDNVRGFLDEQEEEPTEDVARLWDMMEDVFYYIQSRV